MQKIIVAQGIQIRDSGQGADILAFLNANADIANNIVWIFPKGSGAKATVQVTLVFTMAELAMALNTPDTFVIYEGHSRYGQGPAFGPSFPLAPDPFILMLLPFL